MILRKAVRAAVILASCVAIGVPAWSHHSMIAYETNEQVTVIEGTVHAVYWTNPHMVVELMVPTEGGKAEMWTCEGGPVASAAKAGLTPKVLAVGVKAKVYGRRHRDHTQTLAIMNSIEIDGKVYGRNSSD